jgi:hypothetical protein
MQIVLAANIRGRPAAGGHAAAIRQWEAGLRGVGCDVILIDTDGSALSSTELASLADADAVFNVMGIVPRAAVGDAGCWVFVDLDPGYPQLWRQLGLADVLDGHDRFVTIGQNIGRTGCSIPDCGLDWITTPPPVVLSDWPLTPAGSRYTTIATWRNSYGTIQYGGRRLGSRVHEFRRFLDLPAEAGVEFELALDIDPAETSDLKALRDHGWRLTDPRRVAGTTAAYRQYIQGSRAEFSVAQNMYVETRSAWLSDRTLAYLASGRPVVAQDTGFTDFLRVGEGLVPFDTLAEAVTAVQAIERHYVTHSRAARALVGEHFEAGRVLRSVLERAGLGLAEGIGW